MTWSVSTREKSVGSETDEKKQKLACIEHMGKLGRSIPRPYKELLDCVIVKSRGKRELSYSSDFSKLAGGVYGCR